MGTLTRVMQQLCVAHGIQLAVVRVLYPPPTLSTNVVPLPSESDQLDSDVDDDDDDHDGFVTEVPNRNFLELQHTALGPLVTKIRKVVKLFRKSPTKNDDVLQPYVKKEFGREISLSLDCKTRWSSMFTMLETFSKVIVCVQKSLLDLRSDIVFSDQEVILLQNAINALLPIKLTVEAICRRDANLLTTDAALSFLLQTLSDLDSEISRDLKHQLEIRICERRLEASSALKYLHGGFSSHHIFKIATKANATMFVKSLLVRLYNTQVEEENTENTVNESDEDFECIAPAPTTLKEQMEKAISLAINTKPKPVHAVNNFADQIRQEMSNFETSGLRGQHLQKCYDYLLSIPPTSVESERAFSSSTLLCTKIKSSLKDDTLNALCFLKAHFLRQQLV